MLFLLPFFFFLLTFFTFTFHMFLTGLGKTWFLLLPGWPHLCNFFRSKENLWKEQWLFNKYKRQVQKEFKNCISNAVILEFYKIVENLLGKNAKPEKQNIIFLRKKKISINTVLWKNRLQLLLFWKEQFFSIAQLHLLLKLVHLVPS